MTVRPIRLFGDPVLRSPADPVTLGDTRLEGLVEDLLDTVRVPGRAGVAAPQIGVNLQVVIFGFGHNERYPDAPPVPETVLINPTITPVSLDMEEGWEGCLSVPGLRGAVSRFSMIKYHGFDQYGKPIDRVAEGFHARVVQHECDHLIGKLYPIRVRDFTQFGFTSVLFPGLDPQPTDD